MYSRWFQYRKLAVVLALIGGVVYMLPEMASAVAHVVDVGAGSLGFADLAADTALLVALALALLGVAGGRSWGRWFGRGVGLYWLARVAGGLFVFGTVRALEMLLLFTAGVLLVSVPPPEKAYEGALSSGSATSWKRWLGGWALAFNVALLPVLLAPINRTVASALGDSVVTLALVASALALIATVGALLVLSARTSGLLLCLAADLIALVYFWHLVMPRELGHHELVLIAPATVATLVAAAALALPSIRSLGKRSADPIL